MHFQAHFYKSSWSIIGLMVELSQDLYLRAAQAVRAASQGDRPDSQAQQQQRKSTRLSGILSVLGDSPLPNLLNVSFLSLALAPTDGIKPLLPRLVTFMKASATLECALVDGEGGPDDLCVSAIRDLHELLTFVVSRTLGRMMSQRPESDQMERMEARFGTIPILGNGLGTPKGVRETQFSKQIFDHHR